jgi:hypothetical protein
MRLAVFPDPTPAVTQVLVTEFAMPNVPSLELLVQSPELSPLHVPSELLPVHTSATPTGNAFSSY